MQCERNFNELAIGLNRKATNYLKTYGGSLTASASKNFKVKS
ncbi:hypothetical protein MNBD_GAMMA01-733 [hydrothermal vent metagenome]|uniref:Uncharacterized protein n=1 Tax=hydrothermal vent metagenome TaxID=652676 RepID=A0A3B0V489_9ZZZZ